MADTPKEALEDVLTAIRDVLEGYETLYNRAEPAIQPTVQSLMDMHEKHAGDLETRLVEVAGSVHATSSIRGSVNKLVVAVRDWVSTLDEDVLTAVRDGEKRLRDIYDEAMRDWSTGEDPETGQMLSEQWDELDRVVGELPQS